MPTDVERLIREAMKREAARAPVADQSIVKAASRRGRHRRWAVTAGVLATASAIAVGAVVLLPADRSRDVASGPAEGIDLPSSGWDEGEPGHTALFGGVLEVANGDCLFGRVSDDVVFGLLWPEGWTATTDENGTIEVRDREHQLVLREGDRFHVGGSARDVADVCGIAEASMFGMEARPTADPE